MSDTTTVEPPVEPHPLLRRASDPKPLPPRIPASTPAAASRNGFSFMQVAALVAIAVFVNGVFLLYVALRTPTSTTSAPVAVTPAPAPAKPVVVAAPAAPVQAAVTEQPPAPVKAVAAQPVAAKPVVSPPVKHHAMASPKPAAEAAPAVLAAPVIDSIQYDGPIVHLAWKSLGKDVTYKVYVSPNELQPSFEFRFNKYGPSMDWFLNENKAWRYVAITVVDKNGKESVLSNTVDTTPSLPKPEY